MSTENPVLRLTIKIAAATKPGRFVGVDGAAPAANGSALGPVYTETKAAGEHAAVTVLGVAEVEAGGAVAAGDALKVTAAGKVIENDLSNAAHRVVGRALGAAAADGDIIRALLIPN